MTFNCGFLVPCIFPCCLFDSRDPLTWQGIWDSQCQADSIIYVVVMAGVSIPGQVIFVLGSLQILLSASVFEGGNPLTCQVFWTPCAKQISFSVSAIDVGDWITLQAVEEPGEKQITHIFFDGGNSLTCQGLLDPSAKQSPLYLCP